MKAEIASPKNMCLWVRNIFHLNWGLGVSFTPHSRLRSAGGVVGVFLKSIGVDRWLEANRVESLKRFQSLVEAEVFRQAVR
jgi:hypothetical protein